MAVDFSIKIMDRATLDFAVEWAAKEGWNPGLHDADAFYAADPKGFLIGYLGNEPIGCISAVSYQNRFGFLGFYIVVPEQRGKGYGIQLWRAAMERLAGCNVGLDGVVEQQANYRKSGFKFAYNNLRYEYIPTSPTTSPTGGEIVPLAEVPFDVVTAYDRQCFPEERQDFLRTWLALPGAQGLAWVENGRLHGYGLIRACRRGYKIGPLFADKAAIADGLFQGLCSFARNGEPVYLDVPAVNAAAAALADAYGMKKVFGTARMYTGPAPEIDLEKVFGVTSFELG